MGNGGIKFVIAISKVLFKCNYIDLINFSSHIQPPFSVLCQVVLFVIGHDDFIQIS